MISNYNHRVANCEEETAFDGYLTVAGNEDPDEDVAVIGEP